jgi:hypothetical protein
MDQNAFSYKMPIRYDFEAPFEVKIYERERWKTGMGIYGPSVRYYEALGASTTIFQASMYGQPSCVESVEIIHFHLKASGKMSQQTSKADH